MPVTAAARQKTSTVVTAVVSGYKKIQEIKEIKDYFEVEAPEAAQFSVAETAAEGES